MKTLLFVAYGGGHFNMLLPLALACAARHDLRVVTMALTTAAETARRHGLTPVGFADLMGEGDDAAIRKGAALAEELGAAAKVDRRETESYLGLSYMDLVERLGAAEAERRFAAHGRQAFLPMTTMARAFDRFRPDLLITTNSPRAEKAAQLLASERGVPSLCLVDLFDPREFKDRLAAPGYGTRICVHSEGVRRMLVEMGRPAEEVVVTGNPDFDRLADPALAQAAGAYRTRIGADGKRLILWARGAQPRDAALYPQIERALMQAVTLHEDWHVILRPHPNDSFALPDQVPARVTVGLRNDDLAVMLHACDMVVTVTSTVGLQGVALGKALVAIECGYASAFTPYSKLGLARGASTVDRLEPVIEQSFAEPLPLPDMLPLGTSTARVMDVLESLLGGEGA